MDRRRFRLLAAALAVLAGGVVFLVATELFPYHTINHDEGVYLQQAAMLLEGQLSLFPPVPESFRPWFVVRDGARLYPKYAPVPAAMFAVGKLLGGARLSLALIAAGSVALTTVVAAEAFDRRTGLLTGAFLLASPLFLVDSSVFLPYAPTTFWNLLFALAYFRSARSERSDASGSSRRTYGYALLAGLAVGAAFFARPYTAVLFAIPFLVHALYALWTDPSADRVTRLSLTALGGLAGVAAALAYNAAMTGSPWTFPYEAFAPEDGLGFGHRQLLGYERTYTPELALRANAEVVSLLFTEWVVAGPVGALLAAVGVGGFLRRVDFDRTPRFTDTQARAVLAGLFVSVVAGNVYFWGNLNVLGALEVPDDGLVATLGPYYHFDLLVPTAAFAARGALFVVERVHALTARRLGGDFAGDPARARQVTAGVALVGVVLLAGATAGVLAPTVAENAGITAEYRQAYQPFEDRHLSDAVVFLPTPYGDWLNHPFQQLRNDPGFDGETMYAASDGPQNLDVVAAYPNRTYYRYVYRGEWAPASGDSVDPALHRVRAVRGERVAVNATLAVPDYARDVSARLSTGDEAAYYAFEGTPSNLSVALRVANGTARIAGPNVSAVGENPAVPVGSEDTVVAQVFVGRATGGFSYRLELPVKRANGSVVALSPVREVCVVPANCNGAAAYVPGAVPEGIRMETSLRATESPIVAELADGNSTASTGSTDRHAERVETRK